MHRFHSVVIDEAAIFNVKLGVVQVLLTSLLKILISGDVSDDVNFRGKMEHTITPSLTGQAGGLSHRSKTTDQCCKESSRFVCVQ